MLLLCIRFRNMPGSSWTLRMQMRRHISFSPSCQKKIPSNLKGKSTSSQEWLTRQLNDPYVKKAHEMNFRARSAFKLIEIDDRAKFLKPGQTVIECGAAPGAWTQVIIKRINADGKAAKRRVGTVIGIDLLPIGPMEGAIFLSGCDFTSKNTLERIKEILSSQRTKKLRIEKNNLSSDSEAKTEIKDESSNVVNAAGENDKQEPGGIIKSTDLLVDVVLSDMAPNATGVRETDHYRIVKLVEAALAFAVENGKSKGHFMAKLWDGSGAKKIEHLISSYYDEVSRYKPPSSRNDSSEFFILGKFKK